MYLLLLHTSPSCRLKFVFLCETTSLWSLFVLTYCKILGTFLLDFHAVNDGGLCHQDAFKREAPGEAQCHGHATVGAGGQLFC